MMVPLTDNGASHQFDAGGVGESEPTFAFEYPADRLPRQLAQQLLSNPHYVVFSVILAS
jgi:hypothetical protein